MMHRIPLARAAVLALSLGAAPALLATAALPFPAEAAAPAAQLSERDRADVARVERYLNDIKTLRSDFVQAADDGGLARGTFYMSRPGKMRLEYASPSRDYIVSDGWFVFYWDSELKQQSSTPLGSTLADLILRENLKLSGDVTVTRVDRRPGVLEVTVVETKEPGKGRLTLVFEDEPLRLRKWRVLDAQGLTTEVSLQNPQLDVPLDRRLFVFVDPSVGGQGQQQSR